MKHKVAFIHPDLGIGGAERLVLDIAVALAERGNEVVFITNHFDRTHAFEELKEGKFPVRVIGDWIPRSFCGICQALCAYIRMLYLSLVYTLFLSPNDNPDVYIIDQIPMAVPFVKATGGKVVYYCHHPDLLASPQGGILKRLYRLPIDWLEQKGTALSDIILVNSKYTASVFRKTFPEITKNIEILYPTISTAYQAVVLKSKTKTINEVVPEIIRRDMIVFLSINRFHPAKKLELALHGFEALKNKISSRDWPRVHLIMAGGYDPQSSVNANYFSKLVQLAEAKDISTKVTFIKSPSDSKKADLLLACDCLIYTPVNEHFGIVPLEAMSAGKPVIACNSGGPCETVQHEVTGYLCSPTPDSLAEAMAKMLNKNDSCRMGLLGKGRLQKYFSHDTFRNCANSVVQSIISGTPLNLHSPEVNISPSIREIEKIVETEEIEADLDLETEKSSKDKKEVETSYLNLSHKDQEADDLNRKNESNNAEETAKGADNFNSPQKDDEEESEEVESDVNGPEGNYEEKPSDTLKLTIKDSVNLGDDLSTGSPRSSVYYSPTSGSPNALTSEESDDVLEDSINENVH